MRKTIDLTGQTFGFLTVQERYTEIKIRASSGVEWVCICKCGRKSIRTTSELRRSLITRNRPMCWDCYNERKLNRKYRRMSDINEVIRYEIGMATLVLFDLEKSFGPLDQEEHFTNEQIDPYLI